MSKSNNNTLSNTQCRTPSSSDAAMNDPKHDTNTNHSSPSNLSPLSSSESQQESGSSILMQDPTWDPNGNASISPPILPFVFGEEYKAEKEIAKLQGNDNSAICNDKAFNALLIIFMYTEIVKKAMEEGTEWCPHGKEWATETEKNDLIQKLTHTLRHVNGTLYKEANVRKNLVKCMRLIKERETLRRRLKSLRKQSDAVIQKLKKNQELMTKMAKFPLY